MVRFRCRQNVQKATNALFVLVIPKDQQTIENIANPSLSHFKRKHSANNKQIDDMFIWETTVARPFFSYLVM